MLEIRKVVLIGLYILLYASGSIRAQRSTIYVESEKAFKEGMELYQKEKYASAESKFEELLANSGNVSRQTRSDAEFFRAACALELFHDNAKAMLQAFIRNYPESPLVSKAHYKLGLNWFREKKFKTALEEFNLTDAEILSKPEWYEFKYKTGYSYFMTDELPKALVQLKDVKDADNVYKIPATYYFAHINYSLKKWETALENFKKIEKEKNFSGLVPYYIAQIYYFQKKYDQVIEYAKPLADTSESKYSGQINRILAESFYYSKKYDGAIVYYQKYISKGNVLDREGNYRYGMAFYNNKNYKQAPEILKEVCIEDDSLTQNAYYFMADCYLKNNEKAKAQDAFKQAYKTKGDQSVTEDALYNFAKLSFDLDYDPYNEAIKALRDYLEKYPNSPRRDKLYEYLAEVYMTTKNYEDALVTIDKIKNKSRRFKEAYQRIAYFRGLELFNEGNYKEAMKHFALAEKENADKEIFANSVYWTAEAYYRMGKFNESMEAFDEFIQTPGALSTEKLPNAYYGLGYIFYKQKNYIKASVEFRKYADNGKDVKRKSDALLRVGDCFYAQKEMGRALEYYNQAIDLNKYDVDYALLQKAIILGIQGSYKEKIAALKRILNEYPATVYKAEVLYETGNTQMKTNENKEALSNFESVVTNYASSVFAKKSYLKIGLIYFNSEDDKNALAAYKKVLELYPGTEEADDALKYVKNIYVDEGDMDAFNEFLASVKGINISNGSLDSATYQSAENLMLKGDCDKATTNFDKYISKFPDGTFRINAHYYRAECLYRKEQDDKAIGDFEYVIENSPNNFSENALLRAGEIYTEKNNYTGMKSVFEKLEAGTELKENKNLAEKSLMIANFELKQYSEALRYAKIVLAQEKGDETVTEKALYISAKSEFALGNKETALVHFKKLSQRSGSEYNAEAKYVMCEDLYNNADYATCEKMILADVNALSAYPDWLAKAFILLSDTYVKRDNLFQAKATLQSIIDNHEGAEMVKLAKEKLALIVAEEQKRNELKDEPSMEFDMGK